MWFRFFFFVAQLLIFSSASACCFLFWNAPYLFSIFRVLSCFMQICIEQKKKASTELLYAKCSVFFCFFFYNFLFFVPFTSCRLSFPWAFIVNRGAFQWCRGDESVCITFSRSLTLIRRLVCEPFYTLFCFFFFCYPYGIRHSTNLYLHTSNKFNKFYSTLCMHEFDPYSIACTCRLNAFNELFTMYFSFHQNQSNSCKVINKF